jgi:hypothetical protein
MYVWAFGWWQPAKMMRALPREILSGHIIYPPAPLNYSNWTARSDAAWSLGQMMPSWENGSSQIGPAWLDGDGKCAG